MEAVNVRLLKMDLPKETFHCVWVCIDYFDLAVLGLYGVVRQHCLKYSGTGRQDQAVHWKSFILANDSQV